MTPMPLSKRALLVFFRYPELGKVKTRLAAAIGEQEALRVHTFLLRRTLGVVYDFSKLCPDASIVLCPTPPQSPDRMERELPGPWKVVDQEGAHLGERMGNALRWALDGGAEQAVLVGSDLADLQPGDLRDAFVRLRGDRVVLGPARDGGFYLVGVRRFAQAPFLTSEWGTSTVFERTVNGFRSAGFQIVCVSRRQDVDRPEDLAWLHRDPLIQCRLSVVVPTLRRMDALHPWLRKWKGWLWPEDEVIVVRGIRPGEAQSSEIVEEDVRIVSAPMGRGQQLDHGARLAGGSVLLFLHDDTELPGQFPYLVRQAALNPRMALGCFCLRFSPSTRALDLIAHWANARTRLFGLPYGDQALFCRKEVFDRVGGYRRRYLMEDVELVRACRNLGALTVLDELAETSPARYQSLGVLRASLRNHATLTLHFLGVDEERLHAWYYRR